MKLKKSYPACFISNFTFMALFTLVFFSIGPAFTQPAPLSPTEYEVYQQKPDKKATENSAIDNREKILRLFAFVDEFEKNFTDMKYLNVLGRLPELKTKFGQAQQYLKQIESQLSEDQSILASLYIAKFHLFEGMGSVMKNLRIDSGFRAAIMRSGFVVMSLYNHIIEKFRVPGDFSKTDLEELKWRVSLISRRTQKYNVSSKYLTIAGNKIPTGEKIMILEIKDKKALALYMGPTMNNQQIEGWVSLRDLAKRTDWKNDNVIFFRDVRK